MDSKWKHGSARLYSLEAAITCPSCAAPLFVQRSRVQDKPMPPTMECPVCECHIEFVLTVKEGEES